MNSLILLSETCIVIFYKGRKFKGRTTPSTFLTLAGVRNELSDKNLIAASNVDLLDHDIDGQAVSRNK